METTTTTTPAAAAASAFQLLQLPDACLVRALQRLTDNDDKHDKHDNHRNHRSLFSAARAHSRLRTAAAEALRALQAVVRSQQQADSALLYLARHGQHVSSISLQQSGDTIIYIRQLPSQCSQLRSLKLSRLDGFGFIMQLGTSDTHQGVLQACAGQLTRLEAYWCRLREDSPAAPAAALAALTGLQHLDVDELDTHVGQWEGGGGLPGLVWSALSRLTSLTLKAQMLPADAAALEGISNLAQLEHLKLNCTKSPAVVTPAVLSWLQRLRRLELHGGSLEPAALACVASQLQHLGLLCPGVPADATGTAALLAQVARMQQLTKLRLGMCLIHPAPSAAAYSALTASTGLQRLDLAYNYLLPGALQAMFAARQRTALQQLQLFQLVNTVFVEMSSGDIEALVACCPRLQALQVPDLQEGAQLQPISRLAHLTSLGLEWPDASPAAGVLVQLPQLQELQVSLKKVERLILQGRSPVTSLLALTQLTQLTRLCFNFEPGNLENKVRGRRGQLLS
jgi:hypothetical protein